LVREDKKFETLLVCEDDWAFGHTDADDGWELGDERVEKVRSGNGTKRSCLP
jgi:hypothetical protein